LPEIEPGLTMGHQKRSPPARNVTCCTRCHAGELMPSAWAAGTCQATTTAVPASQQDTGCAIDRPMRRTAGEVPSRIKGAAIVIKSRCCTMWKVSSS